MKEKMKNRTSKFKQTVVMAAVISAALSTFSVAARAQSGVDPKTRDLLIEKLTQVYLNLAPSDASKVPITLRLADLHAERARLDAMKDLDSGCTVCEAGKADRQKALQYYQEVLPKVPADSMGKVLAQVGHLYEMTGDEKDAVTTYQKILASSPKDSEANLSLAEVYFKHKDYAHARPYYQAVVDGQGGSRGLAAYRLAWCDFNDGKTDEAINAIKKILTTPELLTKSGSNGAVAQTDRQFQEEVSHDLATFMAHKTVSQDDGKLVYDLSPEQAKLANVSYLASECERLGQPQGAITLWRFVQEKQTKPQARLEGAVHLAQLEMEQKQLPQAQKDFEQALSLWQTLGAACADQDCKELHARLRKFVTDWNRSEKNAPSDALLTSYTSYIKTFPQEADMQVWAGKVAQDLKQYAKATELDLGAAKTAAAPAGTGGAQGEILEAALLQAIEAAELSKDNALLAQAYDSYLAQSKTQKKALEVRYQKAHLIYDAQKYDEAAQAMREVALSKEAGPQDLKTQAAQLSLDSLVLLKDDARLEAWSKEYAKAFPKDAADFQGISRKSVLTQAAAEATKGDQASLDQAWATLSRFDLSTASTQDKAAYYKNRLVLAEKLGKFAEAREAVENLLKTPNLTPADQQYALSRKAWLAEMVLDFDTALATTAKLTSDGLPKDQKALKLAMYAELASKDPKPYYTEFLKTSKDTDKNVSITAAMIRTAKDPMKEIQKNQALLSKKPDVLADLYMEQYAANMGQRQNIDIAKKAVANAAIAATPSGKVLQRAVILDEYSKLAKKLTSAQIDSSTQKKMAAGLKARVAMLDESEKLANKAIASGDWTAELVTLDLLSKQSERFYQEVLALPVPQGLSEEDQNQYLQALSQQAAPYQLKANDVAKKVSEFWGNKEALDQLEQASTTEIGARRTMVMSEVKSLDAIAPETTKAQLDAMLAKSEPSTSAPSLASIEGARQAVRENPMSRPSLEALLAIEKKSPKSETMVAYLEGRLQSLGTKAEPNAITAPATKESTTP